MINTPNTTSNTVGCSQAELFEVLCESFKDRRLDQSEKYTLLNELKAASMESKAFVRNRAFDLVEEAAKTENIKPLLKWLEKIIKAIDATDAKATEANAYFSPGDDCKDALLTRIQQAERAIDICIFTLSDNDISEVLIKRHQHGIKIRIITDDDKAGDRGSDVDYLASKGILLKKDKTRHHMHHKFALFDNSILVTGSFNWTRSATEYNHENILSIDDSVLVEKYQRCFETLWEAF
ncbi:MAG: nuclease [Agarilytica sp.]